MSRKENNGTTDERKTSTASTRKLNKWFNARAWIDANSIERSCSALKSMFTALKTMFLGSEDKEEKIKFDDFNQMMERLDLNEQAVDERTRWLKRTSWIYFLMTCLTLVYVVYLWLHGGWLLGVLSISFVLFLAAMTCRERMRYYQLKNHLTSCTFDQWWHDFCRGNG